MRTSATSGYPRVWRERCTACPWGSRMPSFGVTKTRASHRMPAVASGSRADPPRDLLIRLLDAPEVAPKAILVELLARRAVPEPTGVGTDLVAENDLTALGTAELELHVDEHDSARLQERDEHRVHLERELDHAVDLRLGRHPEHAHVPIVDHGIVERVALVEELDDRLGKRLPFLEPEALRETPRDDVADDHLDGHDRQAPHQHVAVVEATHEVRRHAG